jgi:RNA polymerase primary sigma factor
LDNSGRRRRSVEILSTLLEKADVQGYLTTQDLVEVYPAVSSDMQRMEAIVVALRRRGVDVLEPDINSDYEIAGGSEDYELEGDNEIRMQDMGSVSSDDTIGLYLKEMSRVALLNVEEELDLARRIERGRQARCELSRMIGRGTSPTGRIQRRRSELTGMMEDGILAREHLIKANTRLVVSIAKRYIGRGVPFLDLIQEGNLGLMKAVEKFEYQRGFRFSTYATWWIRQTITRSIADQGRTIRVPVHMVDRIRQLYRQEHEMEQKLGRSPTNEELGDAIGVTSTKIDWMQRVSWLPLSLESPINDEEEDSELGMFIEDQVTPSPIQSAYGKLLRDKVEQVLDTLPPREARILRMRFGLDDGRAYTLEEVGQKFGLTRERIRQIESKALSRLRHPRRARQLRDYL